MTRVLKGRLRKLEAQHKPEVRRHFIRAIGEADAERKLAALKASPEYQEGDHVFRLRWVSEEMADRIRNRGR